MQKHFHSIDNEQEMRKHVKKVEGSAISCCYILNYNRMRKDRFALRGTRISHAQQHLCSLRELKASLNVQRAQSDVLDTNAKLFDKLESLNVMEAGG